MAKTSYSELGLLALTEPAKAREAVVQAMRTARMHLATAAEALGVHQVTLRRLVVRLGLGPALKKLSASARREGWYDGSHKGWPKGRERGPWTKGQRRKILGARKARRAA